MSADRDATMRDPALDKYTAEKLRSVADFLDPKT